MDIARGKYREKRPRAGRRPWQPRSEPSLPDPDSSQDKIEEVVSAEAPWIDKNKQPAIENVEVVSTFNWKDTPEPTIMVPGKPPKWQRLKDTPTLHEDDGTYYRDPNSARFPSYPTEPALRAILHQNPDFNVTEIDVFGCGNTFGSLLSFARGEDRTFRFGVELIGSSLFFVRKTNAPGETMREVRGYGHTFPDAYTTWERDVRGSVSHQRIIKYMFAGLRCFVRSESDGYLPDLYQRSAVEKGVPHTLVDDHTDIEQLSVSGLSSSRAPLDSATVAIQEVGESVPQRAVFDLKTRGKAKATDVSATDFLHRLWVNQTPNFVLAFHTRGRFIQSDIHIIDVRQRVKRWEQENAEVLAKFGSILHKLMDTAHNGRARMFEVRRIKTGPLEVWTELPSWSALPAGLKMKWRHDKH